MEVISVFEEYASIQAQIKALEAKEEQLRPVIINTLIEQKKKKMETSLGNFNLGARKVWTYPVNVKNLKDEYDSAKAIAESTGEATYEEVPQLRFTSVKL